MNASAELQKVFLNHRRIVVTRSGDTVYLSWKQLAVLLVGCILPAASFGGSLWHWAERVVNVEHTNAVQEKRLDAVELRLLSIESRDAMMARFEQHLIDIDRQLMEIRAEQKKHP